MQHLQKARELETDLLCAGFGAQIKVGYGPGLGRTQGAEIRQLFPGPFVAAVIKPIHKVAGTRAALQSNPEEGGISDSLSGYSGALEFDLQTILLHPIEPIDS